MRRKGKNHAATCVCQMDPLCIRERADAAILSAREASRSGDGPLARAMLACARTNLAMLHRVKAEMSKAATAPRGVCIPLDSRG